MSFDEGSASTLDVVYVSSMESYRVLRPRRTRRPSRDASTIDLLLEHASPAKSKASVLTDTFMAERPFTIEGDVVAFTEWMKRERTGALLEVVADMLARKTRASSIIAVLEIDPEESSLQRAVLLATVAPDQADALDRLLEFTSSPWWLRLVREVSNTIVVDIQRG